MRAQNQKKTHQNQPLVLTFPWTDGQRGFDLKLSNTSLTPFAQILTSSIKRWEVLISYLTNERLLFLAERGSHSPIIKPDAILS